MSLPRVAEGLVNWVPGSCMPSPEAPARRRGAGLISWGAGGGCLGSATGFAAAVMKTILTGGQQSPPILRPLRIEGEGAGVGRQVINGGRIVLHQVMHNSFHREHSQRSSRLIDHGQVPETTFFHA